MAATDLDRPHRYASGLEVPTFADDPRGEGLPTGDTDDTVRDWVNNQSWEYWKDAYRPWWRQVEESARMLSGRQWDTFIESLGEFIDLSSWFAVSDERWRKYPTFNWLAHYYKLTLSKLTENVPGIGFLPATPDEKDARLASVMEPVWKNAWRRMNMAEQMFPLYGWVIVAGRGIIKQRWNPDLGDARDFTGPALIHLQGPDGGIEPRVIDQAPYVRLADGSVVPHILNQPSTDGAGNFLLHGATGLPVFQGGDLNFGPPDRDRAGDIDIEIPSPVSLIVPHGPEPFYRKPWIVHEYLLDVDEIARRFGVEVQPENISAEEVIQLKLQYGTNYGIPTWGFGGYGNLSSIHRQALKNTARVRERWTRAVPSHPVLERGRLTIVTHDQILQDDINPYWTETNPGRDVWPFEAFDLIRYPFRQEGTSDFEIMNPIQRAVNRRMGAIMDSVDYNEQPLTVIARGANIEESPAELNRPGATTEVDTQGVPWPPITRLPPASIPQSSVQLNGILQNWLMQFGSQPLGSEGLPVTTDASGELQREVRFDTDRVWGATLRAHSYVWARAAETMVAIYGACVTDDRLLALAGEDAAWEFLTIRADIFSGTIHAVPTPESAVLESRQDKQNRIMGLVAAQIIPPPMALELLQYPDLHRLTRPGGPAWSMAERENFEMFNGQMAQVLPEQDHAAHLQNHKRRMQTIEYRDAGPRVQALFRLHVYLHEQMAAQESIQQLKVAAPTALAGASLGRLVQQVHAGPGGPAGNGGSAPSGSRPPSPGNSQAPGPTPGAGA